MKKLIALSAVTVACVGASTAVAGTNGFYVPTYRGASGSQAGYWESFSVAVGAPGNKANFGNDTTSVLTQTQADAIAVGSGNIYNMPSASEFTISYSGSGPVGLVTLQARTSGTELDYGSVSLNYGAGTLTATRVELDRTSFGTPGVPGPQGFNVSSAWTWDLSPYAASGYTISFKAAEPSLSFDSATLDTQVVPEPGTWALAGLGVAAMLLAGRRHSRRNG